MNCQQIHKLIHAYQDAELDAANTLLVDEHLADCPRCFGTLRNLAHLRGVLQGDGLRYSAPATLRRSIRTAIAQAAAGEEERSPSRPWFHYLGWVAAAVVVAAQIVVFELKPARLDDRLISEITSSHVRSLMAAHLADVISTDQHTVKPWFDGKLDFAPPVRDLRDSGFPLLGGRLDFIDGHPAAALVYGRQKHIVNLLVWPSKDANPQDLRTVQHSGYNIARWSDGKMEFSAVSDLNETDLRLFVSDLSAR